MTSEAKQYAQRNRQGSDWFYHDAPDAAPAHTTDAAPIPTPAEKREDAHAADIEKIELPEPEEQENGEKESEENGEHTKEETVPTTARGSQLIRPKCDSNNWLVLLVYLH